MGIVWPASIGRAIGHASRVVSSTPPAPDIGHQRVNLGRVDVMRRSDHALLADPCAGLRQETAAVQASSSVRRHALRLQASGGGQQGGTGFGQRAAPADDVQQVALPANTGETDRHIGGWGQVDGGEVENSQRRARKWRCSRPRHCLLDVWICITTGLMVEEMEYKACAAWALVA